MSGDRMAVKTYVPEYQKQVWEDHAADLDMSLAEFVRTMVQAGRRGFEPDRIQNPVEPASSDPTPRGDGLKSHLLDVLRSDGPLSWGELLEEASDELEDRLETVLEELEAENRIRYNPRKGGYELRGGT